MKIKINTKILKKFIEKCSLKGKIETGIIRRKEDKLILNIKSGNTIAVFGNLKISAISEIDKGDISLPIKSMGTFIKILDTFDEYIFLETEKNVLKVYDSNREAEIILASEDYIENELAKPLEFEFENSVKIEAGIFTRTLRNSEIVKGETFKIEVKDNLLKISTGREGFDSMEERAKVSYPNCKNRLGPISVGVLDILEGNIELSMKEDYPLKFYLADESMNATYFTVPLEAEEKNDTSGKV